MFHLHTDSSVDPRRLAPQGPTYWRDLWARTALVGAAIIAVYFVAWELVERAALASLASEQLHFLHLVRGALAACLVGTWAFLSIRQSRVVCDASIDLHVQHLEARVRERTRELDEARSFAELLFDSLPERLVVVDKRGTIVRANRVAVAVAGVPLVGSPYAKVFPGRGESAGGRAWELDTIAVPSGDSGFLIEVGHDVTERRDLEAQVRHQEKMASLGLLAAGFAHDLGNPLASLSSELELLEGEEEVARFRDSLGVLQKQVARMTRMLREMGDFARRRHTGICDVGLAAAVADSMRVVSHDPRLRKVRVAVDVPSTLPPIRMVEDHLVLVLVNLIINAADAMPDGGALTIRGAYVGDAVTLRVEDSGVGMAPDVLAQAMTPLFTTKAEGGGTGLGLSVSSNIIASVGGSLDVESTPSVGTVVTMKLPVRASHGMEVPGG